MEWSSRGEASIVECSSRGETSTVEWRSLSMIGIVVSINVRIGWCSCSTIGIVVSTVRSIGTGDAVLSVDWNRKELFAVFAASANKYVIHVNYGVV